MKNISEQWRSVLWFMIPIFILANLYLIFLGEIDGVLIRLAYTVYLGLLAWLTFRVTNPQPAESESKNEAQQNKSKTWGQITVLLVIIFFTGVRANIPVWSDLVDWSFNFGESVLPVEWFGGPGNSIANPLQYFVIPFIILLLMGAKPVELGFGKGHKVWRACLVWVALPFVIWAGLLVTGLMPLQTLARRIIGNFFQNGFFEEFLFRGALQTRLKQIISVPWALTLQAVFFGLWHVFVNTESMDGNLLAGIAVCIISQMVSGFVFGYIFERTRNLIVPTVAHVIMNALGQSF